MTLIVPKFFCLERPEQSLRSGFSPSLAFRCLSSHFFSFLGLRHQDDPPLFFFFAISLPFVSQTFDCSCSVLRLLLFCDPSGSFCLFQLSLCPGVRLFSLLSVISNFAFRLSSPPCWREGLYRYLISSPFRSLFYLLCFRFFSFCSSTCFLFSSFSLFLLSCLCLACSPILLAFSLVPSSYHRPPCSQCVFLDFFAFCFVSLGLAFCSRYS